MKNVLAVALLAFAGVLPLRAEIIEQILVKVNGEILTKTDLEQRQVQALRQRDRGITAEDLRNDAELKKALDEVTPQVIADAVDEMLMMQRGRELGYRMSDEQFKSIVENIRKENKLESDEAFTAALRQEGMTMDDLRRSLERQMIMSRLQQVEVFNRIAITDAEAQAYYDAHSDEFTTPATVTLRELFIEVAEQGAGGKAPETAGVNVGLDEEAREAANQLRAKAVAGEDFAKLAAAESDAPSKANGGLIGPMNEDELAPALRQLINRMKVGEISEPLRSPRGYQLLKLESRTDRKVLSFADAREQISDKVFQQKRRGEMLNYLTKLREQAIIEWKNDGIKQAYERGLEARKTAAQPAAPPPGS
jgi:peptidyl-prolyl cis-trans isomerase SurA